LNILLLLVVVLVVEILAAVVVGVVLEPMFLDIHLHHQLDIKY
jgi:hypothetical protein